MGSKQSTHLLQMPSSSSSSNPDDARMAPNGHHHHHHHNHNTNNRTIKYMVSTADADNDRKYDNEDEEERQLQLQGQNRHHFEMEASIDDGNGMNDNNTNGSKIRTTRTRKRKDANNNNRKRKSMTTSTVSLPSIHQTDASPMTPSTAIAHQMGQKFQQHVTSTTTTATTTPLLDPIRVDDAPNSIPNSTVSHNNTISTSTTTTTTPIPTIHQNALQIQESAMDSLTSKMVKRIRDRVLEGRRRIGGESDDVVVGADGMARSNQQHVGASHQQQQQQEDSNNNTAINSNNSTTDAIKQALMQNHLEQQQQSSSLPPSEEKILRLQHNMTIIKNYIRDRQLLGKDTKAKVYSWYVKLNRDIERGDVDTALGKLERTVSEVERKKQRRLERDLLRERRKKSQRRRSSANGSASASTAATASSATAKKQKKRSSRKSRHGSTSSDLDADTLAQLAGSVDDLSTFADDEEADLLMQAQQLQESRQQREKASSGDAVVSATSANAQGVLENASEVKPTLAEIGRKSSHPSKVISIPNAILSPEKEASQPDYPHDSVTPGTSPVTFSPEQEAMHRVRSQKEIIIPPSLQASASLSNLLQESDSKKKTIPKPTRSKSQRSLIRRSFARLTRVGSKKQITQEGDQGGATPTVATPTENDAKPIVTEEESVTLTKQQEPSHTIQYPAKKEKPTGPPPSNQTINKKPKTKHISPPTNRNTPPSTPLEPSNVEPPLTTSSLPPQPAESTLTEAKEPPTIVKKTPPPSTLPSQDEIEHSISQEDESKLTNQMSSLLENGHVNEAVELEKKRLKAYKKAGNTSKQVSSMVEMADLLVLNQYTTPDDNEHPSQTLEKQKQNSQRVLRMYKNSLRLMRQENVDDTEQEASLLNRMGEIMEQNDNIPASIRYFQDSLQIHSDNSNNEGMASTLCDLGCAHARNGSFEKAKDCFALAESMISFEEEPDLFLQLLLSQARAFKERGKWRMCRNVLEKKLLRDLFKNQESGIPDEYRGDVFTILGSVCLEQQKVEQAKLYFEKAQEVSISP